MLEAGKYTEIGVRMRSSKNNLELPGFTRRTPEGQWQYSLRTGSQHAHN